MGIRFYCPNGHKLHVKAFQAGMRGICPYCGAKVLIPLHSTRPSTKELKARRAAERARSVPSESVTPQSGGEATPELLQPRLGSFSEEALRYGTDAAIGQQGEALSPLPSDQPAVSDFGDLEQLRSFPTPLDEISLPSEGPTIGADFLAGGGPAPPVQESQSSEAHPLAEPNVVWYVRPPAGGQYGPAAPEVVRTWLSEGRITPDTLVWREGWRDWQVARDVFPEMLVRALPEVPVEEQPERRLIRQSTRSVWGQFAMVAFVVVVIAVLGGLIWLLVSRGTP